MSAKSYIVKKINELPTFTGVLSPDDLVAFFDISTGITHKIKVSDIGGGSLDHRDLTQESRFANDQHVMGSVIGLVDKIADLDSEISKERIFFSATAPDFGVITRDYDFKIVAATITAGTLTLQTSGGVTYTIGNTVTAGDYIKVLSNTLNSRAFLKINKV